MSEHTILAKIQSDLSVRLSKDDAKYLGLKPGKTLVITVREPFGGSNAPGSLHATLTVADSNERTPRAFS